MTSPSLRHEIGHLNPMHWDNPEEWDRVGGGLGQGDTCTPMADLCQCMAKTTPIL